MTTKTRAKTQSSPQAQLLRFAREQAKTAGTWIDLHNAIYGIGGKAGELLPTEAERIAWTKTAEYRQVQELIGSLPGPGRQASENFGELVTASNGKILLRLPKSVHAALLVEAEAEGVSLNQLCLAKLCTQLRAAVADHG